MSSSRLFRAVVGLGISLGTASVACLGAVGEPGGAGAVGTEQPPTPSTPGAGNDAGAPTADAAGKVDATVDPNADAAADAPSDALLDAFCDASWPTTKGNPGGPTCGAISECKDSGQPPHCYAEITPGTCDPNPVFPAWCVSSAWRCSGVGVPSEQCKCWVGQTCP